MITLIVTCTFGLEAIVRRELEALGYANFITADGRIEFEGEWADIPRLNINLRTADRVGLKIAEFPAADFDQLFDQTAELPWETWILPDAKITVTGKSVKSKLMSVRTCQSMVKKAILDRMSERLAQEVFPETGAEFIVQVALLKDVALLTLDTTGQGLHKRGYRISAGEAPLRENLAAALVLLSFWDKDRLLIDPMCGSGTILIEAAMIARHMAPGLTRSFAAESWPVVGPELWRAARQNAQDQIQVDGTLKIQGCDIDAARVADAKENARRAGVDKDIEFAVKDMRDLWIDKQYGIIISNPPYGVKLSGLKELTPLYVAIHQIFKNKKGWSLYILTADARFPDFFKRARPDKVRKLFNGNIEVNYYQYFGERPPKVVS